MSRGRSLSRATTFSVPYPGAGGGPWPWTPPMVAPALRAGCAAGHRRLLPLKGPARHSYRPRGCRACVAQIHRGNRERPFTPCPAAPSTVTGRAPGPPGLGRLRSPPAPPGGGGAAAEPVRSPPPERRGEREAARPPAPQVGGVPGGGRADPSRPRGTRALTRRASGDDLVRGLLQKAPGLPSHPCPRRGGDERELAPGERLGAGAESARGGWGRAWGAAVICGREGEPRTGAGAPGCAAPRRPLAAGPGQRAAPGTARARSYRRSLLAGKRQPLSLRTEPGRPALRSPRPGRGARLWHCQRVGGGRLPIAGSGSGRTLPPQAGVYSAHPAPHRCWDPANTAHPLLLNVWEGSLVPLGSQAVFLKPTAL